MKPSNSKETFRHSSMFQEPCFAPCTYDLGGFPSALHITQANTASGTAFLHFSHPPSLIMQYAKGTSSKITSSRHHLTNILPSTGSFPVSITNDPIFESLTCTVVLYNLAISVQVTLYFQTYRCYSTNYHRHLY